MRSFLVCSVCQILGLSKNRGRMDKQCGKHGRKENLKQNFEYLKEMRHSESLCEFESVILKCNLNIVLWEDKVSKCSSTA